MSDVAVSVVVAAYNASATIADTLDSLLAQTFSCWEAVVVDDGSTDRTAQVVHQFQTRDPRLRLVQQPNGGESAARNTGISEARHDWLLFLDADDWIAPDYLEKMTGALRADPSLDAVHCGYTRVAADGTAVVERYEPPLGDLFPTLASRAAFPVHACVVRRRLVIEVGMFDTSLRTSPDWDLWQRIARAGAKFGAVREVLAFYRMSLHSASLDAHQLFRDGLRVLTQGRTADARVPNPRSEYVHGLTSAPIEAQEFYLLCWCAGLLIGSGRDARSLLDLVGEDRYQELYPDAVAQCLFESATLPNGQPPRSWEQLWYAANDRIAAFLGALEAHTTAPDLARTATVRLKRMILESAPLWSLISEEINALTTEFRKETDALRREAAVLREETTLAQRLQQDLADQRRQLATQLTAQQEETRRLEEKVRAEQLSRGSLQEQVAALRTEMTDNARRYAEEINRLRTSPEWRVGDMMWNRARLSGIGRPAARALRLLENRRTRSRLAERSNAKDATTKRRRAVVAACWSFPIPSQTFVYQEMQGLDWAGFDIDVFCCETTSREELPEAFEELWSKRVVLQADWQLNQADLEHFIRTCPDRVDALLTKLGEATGLTRDALLKESIIRMGFTFARHVELSGAIYLHTYFFYDQSLMGLMAAWLLQIPRGVTAYADHMLADYPFKCIPLHLELADIVVATSHRIKSELMTIAGGRYGDKILVKPNGIDTNRFPSVDPAGRVDVTGEPELISVCRVEPKKGLAYLVEAVGILAKRGTSVRLHIVGGIDRHTPTSADYHRELVARIEALGLSDRIVLHGSKQQSEFLPLLRQSRIFVAPYVEVVSGDKDGIPTALLEAMSTGLPVVATDSGSITEVVRDGVEGLIVPQRDPARLADAVERLLSNRTVYIQMATAARNRVLATFDAHVTEGVLHERIRERLVRELAG